MDTRQAPSSHAYSQANITSVAIVLHPGHPHFLPVVVGWLSLTLSKSVILYEGVLTIAADQNASATEVLSRLPLPLLFPPSSGGSVFLSAGTTLLPPSSLVLTAGCSVKIADREEADCPSKLDMLVTEVVFGVELNRDEC